MRRDYEPQYRTLSAGAHIAEMAEREYLHQADTNTDRNPLGIIMADDVQRMGLPAAGVLAMALCRACWVRIMGEDFRIVALIEQALTGDPMEVYGRARNTGRLFGWSTRPEVGSIAIWRKTWRRRFQEGRMGGAGHAGIVTACEPDWRYFHTVEAWRADRVNDVVDRPGFTIVQRARPLHDHKETPGMVLEGFIHPPPGLEVVPVVFTINQGVSENVRSS